jgi:myosin heavy subunit
MVMDRPIGLFSLLEEESRFPEGTPESLVRKLVSNLTGKRFVFEAMLSFL